MLNRALLFLVLCSAAARAADAAPVTERYRQQAAAIHRDAMALRDARNRLMWRAHAADKPDCLTVTLKEAVMNRDMHLDLVRTALGASWGEAWAPKVNWWVHAVSVERFTGRSEFEVSLRMQLNFAADSMSQEITEGLTEVPVAVTLRGEVAGGKVSGKYKWQPLPLPPLEEDGPERPNPMKAGAGAISGTLSRPAQPPKAKSERWAPQAQASAEVLYLLGTALEGKSDGWYRDVRALDMTARHGIGYGEALQQALLPMIERPELLFKAKERTAAGTSISLDDVDLGDGLDDMDPVVVPKRKKSKKRGRSGKGKGGSAGKGDAVLEKGLAELENIAARLARMRVLVEAHEKAGRTVKVAAASLTTEDPEFGPWFGEGVLETEAKSVVNKLPAGVGGEGPQEWRAVAEWGGLLPFPKTRFDLVTPGLPDVVWAGGETCRVQVDRLRAKTRAGLRSWGIGSIWRRPDEDPDWIGHFGYVVPPPVSGTPNMGTTYAPQLGYREYQNLSQCGVPHSTTYMRCVVESPKTVELWAGLGINQQGRLWLNDDLLWHGPMKTDTFRHETMALIRMPFRKGANHLVLRLDNDYSSPFCWLRVCLRGKPRSAAEVKAQVEKIAAVRKTFKPESAVGWRGDGTGVYPGTHPPAAWNRKQKRNVLWHVPLPYFGNATPVPVPGSNKVFITMDPHWLICLDKDTGKELWRRAVNLIDLLPEAERKKGWELNDAWWKALMAYSAVPKYAADGSRNKTLKWLGYQWYWAEETGIWAKPTGEGRDERDGASAELVALLDKRDELEGSADPTAVQDELNRVLKQIDALKEKAAGDDPNSPTAMKKRWMTAKRAYEQFIGKHAHGGKMGGGYWEDYEGWMYGTPVTDGKHVWLKTGTDVAACYDLDGNERWKVQMWGAGGGLASPRLVDGKLIIMLKDCERGNPKKRPAKRMKLLALDAATGEVVWETGGLPDHSWMSSTPGVMALTDGVESMKVMVTACGCVVRVDDGRVLVRNPGAQSGFASPSVVDDIVVFGHAGLLPVRFLMRGRDRVGFRHPWAVRGGCHALLDSGGCIVVDGLIQQCPTVRVDGRRLGKYTCSAWGLRKERGPGEGWRAAESYDLATGRYAGAVPILRKAGNQWSPACASADHVYHILGDHIFQGHLRPKASMDMVSVTRGRDPLRLANNAIDRTYGAGAIEGDRIYIRGYHGATCVGYTGDKGRRWEAEIVARNLLDDLYPGCPEQRPAERVAMSEDSTIKAYPHKHPRQLKGPANCLLLDGHAPHHWWILGPVPAGMAADVFTAFGAGAKRLAGDETVKAGGKELVWGPMQQPFLKVPDFKEWELDPANFSDIHRLRRVMDLGKAIRGRTGVVFLMTELRSDAEQVMRFEQTLPNARAWIAGKEIKHGDRVAFGKGICQLFLEVRVDAVPAGGLHLSPRFWASDDVKQEKAAWARAALKRKPYFDKVLKLAPAADVAKRARKVVDAL